MENEASKISNIIENYCDGEFGTLDEEHVLKWVHQFEVDDRQLILEETNRILRTTYINKELLLEKIKKMSGCNKLTGKNPREYWSNCSLLNIQENGSSQSELIGILKSYIQASYNFIPVVNGISDVYVYVDDFLFSGNRILKDIENWIVNNPVNNCHVEFALIGWFESGHYTTHKALYSLAKKYNRNISFNLRSFKEYKYENRRTYSGSSEVFWPQESVLNDEQINSYLSSQRYMPTFRVDNGKLNRLFSRSRRDQYEYALLKAGIKIIQFCDEPTPVMKPLGYNRYDGFGFGSTVFTHRNCPNNNPLAFWWGDPSYSTAHPFGKWYPLMQRKTYG
ncbi:hypothetical protein ACM8C1_004699 [Vibrio parahaemolyticus]